MSFTSAEILEECLSSACVLDATRYDRLFAWSDYCETRDNEAAQDRRQRLRCIRGRTRSQCGWCGSEIVRGFDPGRPRGFCCHSHKTREMHERCKRLRRGSVAGGQALLFGEDVGQ